MLPDVAYNTERIVTAVEENRKFNTSSSSSHLLKKGVEEEDEEGEESMERGVTGVAVASVAQETGESRESGEPGEIEELRESGDQGDPVDRGEEGEQGGLGEGVYELPSPSNISHKTADQENDAKKNQAKEQDVEKKQDGNQKQQQPNHITNASPVNKTFPKECSPEKPDPDDPPAVAGPPADHHGIPPSVARHNSLTTDLKLSLNDRALLEELQWCLGEQLSSANLPSSPELYRWLKACQMNVSAATEMYKTSQVWRRHKGVDYILDWYPPEVLRKFYPGGFSGYDNDGCPVWIIPFGRADVKGLLSSVSKQEFIDYTIRILETSLTLMRKSSSRLNRPVFQHVFIFDLTGFSFKSATHGPTLDLVQSLISVYEANYPETLKAAYVINAGKFFQLVFNIIKSTVNSNTLAKIHVFGTSDWEKILLDVIPQESLPVYWGGTKVSTIPQDSAMWKPEENESMACTAEICMGGEVPLYYRTVQKNHDIQGVTRVNKQDIAAGTCLEVKMFIRSATHLNWKFKTEGGDISFRVQRHRCRMKESEGKGKCKTETAGEPNQLEHHPTAEKGIRGAKKGENGDKGGPHVENGSTPVPSHSQPSSQQKQVEEKKKNEETRKDEVNLEENSAENIMEEDEESEAELIFDLGQVKSSKECQTGYLHCDTGYAYNLIFDNRDSILRHRKLHYTINSVNLPNRELNGQEDTMEDRIESSMNTPKKEADPQDKVESIQRMEDLMSFVKEVLDSDLKAKNKAAKASKVTMETPAGAGGTTGSGSSSPGHNPNKIPPSPPSNSFKVPTTTTNNSTVPA